VQRRDQLNQRVLVHRLQPLAVHGPASLPKRSRHGLVSSYAGLTLELGPVCSASMLQVWMLLSSLHPWEGGGRVIVVR
jgi:hypothetical protein